MSFRDGLNQFKSKYLTASETIDEKLVAARAEVAALEQSLREKSIDAVLAGDDAALADLQKKLRDARDKIEVLEGAATENQRQERARLSKAASAAEKARLRALRAHVATLSQHAREYEQAIAGAADAWAAMLSTSRKIVAAASAATERDLNDILRPDRLAARCRLEMARHARHPGSGGTNGTPQNLPGAEWDGHGSLLKWQQNPTQVAPLSQVLADVVLGAIADPDKKEPV